MHPLLEHGATVDTARDDGEIPIWVALKEGKVEDLLPLCQECVALIMQTACRQTCRRMRIYICSELKTDSCAFLVR